MKKIYFLKAPLIVYIMVLVLDCLTLIFGAGRPRVSEGCPPFSVMFSTSTMSSSEHDSVSEIIIPNKRIEVYYGP